MAPTPEPVLRAAGSGRVLALTVDDGPAADTDTLLDLLEGLGVRATFCVVGEQVATPGGAARLRRTVAAGHALANHGWDHTDLRVGVVGAVGDWLTQDEAVLVDRLRAAVRPGGVLLVHDGGGDRRGTVAALRRVLTGLLGEGWTFTLPEHPDGPHPG